MDVTRVNEFPQKEVCKKCKTDWNKRKNVDGKCHNCGSTESKFVRYDPETKEIVEMPRLGL